MSDTEDNIPTLNEMIFPGRPGKTSPDTPASDYKSDGQSNSEQAESPFSAPDERDEPKAKQTHFEAFINKQIDEILERHILAAREEIVRVVMLELRSRLPNANHRDP
jgi:hypothetical protein